MRTRQKVITSARPTAAAVAVIESAAGREAVSNVDAPRRRVPADRQRHLEIAVRQRIESRLAGRVRNLVVRATDDSVVLEGECATYYTKQLAQHAALGILEEDEHLENAIVVNVPQ